MFSLTEKQLKQVEDWVKTRPQIPESQKADFEKYGRFSYEFTPTKDYVEVVVKDWYAPDEVACALLDVSEKPEWA